MKNRTIVGFTALLALLSTLNPQLSAGPLGTAFTYQGKLSSGTNAANGSYDLKFSLYDAASGPAQVGNSLTNTATAVGNGYFTVTLDFGNVFDGSARWLEIGVRTNGTGDFTTLSPRQALGPAPYAVYAPNAGTAVTAATANALSGTVAANQLTGTVADARLSTNVAMLANSPNFAGMVTAVGFNGNGMGVTNVDLVTANNQGAIGWTAFWGKFGSNSAPAVGTEPRCVAGADFNRDGMVDLITANYGTTTLTVLTNIGAGSFVLSASPTVDGPPICVAAADFNGDGNPDVVSATPVYRTLTLLTNNGSGGLAPGHWPSLDGGAYFVIAVDLNGDAKPDVVTADYEVNLLTVLTNSGTGQLRNACSPAVGAGPQWLAAADLNGDGKVDLISANGYSLTILTNKGAGVIQSNANINLGFAPRYVTPVDANQDGAADLVIANSSGNSLRLLTNNGTGSFGSNATFSVGSGPCWIAAADFNSDGSMDLVSANGVGKSLTLLTNNGHGGFELSSLQAVGLGPVSVIAVDVNGDNGVDLVSAIAASSTLTVLTNSKASYSANFMGNGSSLTALNAAQLTAGTISEARLSANVALLPANQLFSGTNYFTGVLIATNPANQLTGTGGGTIRGVQAGFGLAGGGNNGEVTLSIDPNSVALKDDLTGFAPLSHIHYGADLMDDSVYSTQLASDSNSLAKVSGNVLKLAGGNVGIDNSNPTNKFVVINARCDGSSWINASDRSLKQGFAPVEPRRVLERVAVLPIQTWSYKAQPDQPHLGPVAQDFHAAFGLGADDASIATVDADGVALAAIQGLNQKLEETRVENAELKRRLERLEQFLANQNRGAK